MALLPETLFFAFFFGHTKQHVGSSLSDQGLNSGPLRWKRRVSTAGPPGQCLPLSS